MNQKARVDSTEELLDVIRGEGSSAAGYGNDGGGKKNSWFKPRRKRNPRKVQGKSLFSLSLAAKQGIGVDVTPESLDILKLSRKDSRAKVLMLERVMLDETMQPGQPGFVKVLRDALGRCMSGTTDCTVWALLRTSEMDVSRLKLPKMPAGRLSSAVYWQLQKEKKFEEDEYVLDFIDQGIIREDGVDRHDIITCLAKQADVNPLREAFQAVGVDLSGITLIPAAFKAVYDVGLGPDDTPAAANIHVDANFTCITIFFDGRLLFSRTIKFGTNSLADDLKEQYSTQAAPNEELVMPSDAAPVKSPVGMTRPEALEIVENMLVSVKSNELEARFGLKRNMVLSSVIESFERVGRQTDRTLEYFAQNFGVRVERLHLSGVVFTKKEVSDFMASQLGLPVEPFDPLGAMQGKVKGGLLDDPVKRIQFNEPLALALCSRGATLNLLHTYQDRQLEASRRRVRNIGALFSLFMTMLLVGLFLYGTTVLDSRRTELAALSKELLSRPVVDESKMQMMAAKTGLRQARVGLVAERYRGLAVLGEVSRLMPDGVRLLALRLDLGAVGAPKTEEKNGGTEEDEPKAVFDGIVLGSVKNAETNLTRFLANLESSALFSEVDVNVSVEQAFVPEGAVLHFILEAKLMKGAS